MSNAIRVNPSTGAGFPCSGRMTDWVFHFPVRDALGDEIVLKGETVNPFGLAALHRSGCDSAWIIKRVVAS